MKSRPAPSASATRFRRKPLITALEPRLLLDGAAVATTVDMATDVDYQDQTADQTVHSASAEDSVHFTEAAAPASTEPARREVAFVDTQVQDYQALIDGMAEGVEVFLIDAGSNGLEQMLAHLQGQKGIDAIHVYSHGDIGQLTLGSLTLNGDNLVQHSSLMTQLGETLGENGDLMLYGCYVGADSEGQAFIDEIARLSGADVAASNDLTGSESLAGDWDLEAESGLVESSPIGVSSFEALLAPTISGLSDISYTEGGSAIAIDNDVSFSGGANYGNGYIQFQVTAGMDTGDQLALVSGGSITLSGSNVYYNGTHIGSIDSTYNGVNGNALRINLLNQTVAGTSPVLNGDFSKGLTNWTAYTGHVDLGVTQIAGWTTPSDSLISYPSRTPGGDDNDLVSGYDSGIVTVVDGRLKLEESSLTTSSYGVVHGPAAYSDAFNATTGMVLKFDWQANYINDDYHVVGYLLNTATGATTIALQSYGSTGSGTASVTVPTTGSYRFVFVSGTFDASGWTVAGASMYIDNIRVEDPFVTDTVVTALTRQITYRNSSDDPTAPSKTITLSALNSLSQSASSNLTVSVTALNDAPSFSSGASLATIVEDASIPSGATISSLFSSKFSDPDALRSPADTLAGIAIVGDVSTSTQGTWEYSTNSGTNWYAIGSVSTSNALLLSSSTLIRFRPSADWNGTPGSLAVHAVDSSHSGGFTSGTTRVTVDTTTDGQTSAVSASAVSLSTSVTAANDAPVLYTNALDGALSFDGVDDYVSFADNDSALNTAFTLETWIRWTPEAGKENAIQFISGKGFEQMELHTSGGGVAGTLRFIPTDGVWLDAANALIAGQWTHVAAVYDETNAVAKLFINGEDVPLVSRGSNPVGTALQSTTTPFYLGQRGDESSRFDGAIGEFRIWNTARTAAEIQANWNSTLTGSESGLVNLWKLNDGVGNTTSDSVTPGTAGTINGATWIAASERTLTLITENDLNNPGNLVSSLIGDAISDPDAGALEGIAITSITSANGGWEYSVDSGTTWQSIGAVSESSALLLRASDKVRFAPYGINGTSATFTFKAWDRSSGTAGTKVDTQTDGGSTAFSEASGSAKIEVEAVNDLPTIKGLAGATINEDNTLSISGFTIDDVDGDTLRIRVTANHGSLGLASSSGVTVHGSGATLEFSGSVADAGTALNSLRYTPNLNFNGSDDLSVEIRDDNGTTWQIYTVDQTGRFFNPNNGHYYEFVSASGISWDDAKTAAEARTLYGLNGYLVTVTSAEEQAFIAPKLGGNGWMGASDAESEGIWKWVTGPETGTQFWTGDVKAGTSSTNNYGSAYNGAYANWAAGEPNNSDSSRGGEDVAHFYSSGVNAGKWNDFAGTNTSIAGYVVEYGGTGFGTLQAAPFTITVTSINDAPVFTSSPVTISLTDTSATDSYSTQSGSIAASDDHSGAPNEDGTLTYGISGGSDTGADVSRVSTYGTLTVTKASGAYSFTPNADAINRLPAGADINEIFTVTVSDGQGGTTSQTFTIQITPANDLPIVVAPTTITLTDSSGASIAGKVGATLAASDVDTGTTLSYAIDNSGSAVTTLAGLYGTLTINASTGAYVYTPDLVALNALDANAADTFTLTVSDGSATVSTTLTIDITATAETAATYTEQDPATAVLTDTVIDTPQSYGGGYIEFALDSGTTSETLALQRLASASTAAGAVSIVGDVVYLGDGTMAKAIGQVDGTLNGLNGKNLRINFAIDFANGNFESSTAGLLSSTVGQTVTIDGWTIVNDRVTLGATQYYDYVQKKWIDNTIAGLATPEDETYPARNLTKTSPDSSTILSTATADNGGVNPYAAGMRDFGNLDSTGFYTYIASGAVSNGGKGNSLQMKSVLNSEAGYEVIRGPYVYSSGTVNLQAGDDVSFYWKAEGGGDAYDVFGYIINVNDPSVYQIILNETGATASSMTAWAQENVTVDSAGEYRFVFVSGTFDATGGEVLGAQLYIDDVKVTQANPTGGIGSAVLEALAKQVTYANSSDLSAVNGTVTRTITVTTASGDATPVLHTSTKALTVQEVNDPVSLAQPATIRYTDTDAPDSFNAASGQLSATDPDSATTFTYGIVNGSSTETTLTGNYGTLTINATTGAYTYTPDTDAINGLSANASDSFTVQVSDGSGSTASRTLTVEIQSVNDAPLLGGAVATTTFVENGAPALVDPDITISDPEGTHYDNGSLTFTTTTNGEPADRFSILETNGISVSGGDVFVGGTLIGTIDSQYDGQNGRALRINLNANAYSLQVQALARSVAFSNPTDDLSGASRSISIEVNDGGNGGTTTARYSTRTATMQVSTINDLPEITLAASSYTVEKVIATNPDGTLALTGLSFADADHGSLSVTLATTRYGSLTLRTDVSGGLSASDIGNNGSRSVTLTGTLAQINATLAASNGLTYVAGSGNDVITPGADYLRITATDAASGQALAQKMVMVLPAVPNADSANIVTAEDGPVSVDISAIIADINDNKGTYVFGTGSADLTDASGNVTPTGTITAFDGSKVIYASHDIDGDGDIDADDTSKAIGYRLDHGSLILDNDQVLGGDFATFTYVPDENWSGIERFVYRYNSGDGKSSYIAEVALYVTAQNDAPEVALQTTQGIDEDTSLVFSTANGNRIELADVDADTQAMTLTLKVENGRLTLASTAGLTVLEGADGSGSMKLQGKLADLQAAVDGLAYRGQQDYNGTDSLTVTLDDLGNAGDGGAESTTRTVVLTVNPVNDNPVGAADANAVVEAGGSANSIAGTTATGNVLINDTDVDVGDTPLLNGAVTFVRETTAGSSTDVTFGTTSIDGRQIAGLYGTLSIGADGSYRYVTDESNAAVQALRIAGQTLHDRFTYTLADAGGLTAEATLTITIDGRNDNPVGVDDTAMAIEAGGVGNATAGANATGNVLTNDTDVDRVANGETKTVSAVRTGAEAATGTSGTVGQSLTGTFGALTLNANGSFTYVIDESNASVQALRVSGQTVSESFTYTVTDAGGLTDQATLTITIDGRNDNPVAVDDAATAIEAGGVGNATTGANATGNVLTNDTDVDTVANGETKTVTAVHTGAEAVAGTSGTVGQSLTGTYGALTLNADGSYTYVIDESNTAVQALRVSGQTVSESFTYTVTDAGGLTDQATLTITIDGRNDAPVADNVGIDQTWPFGKGYSFDISTRFSDVDSAGNGENLDFTLTGLPDGLSYDAETGLISGIPTSIGKFTVTMTAADRAGASVSRQFVLEILAPPQPAVAAPVADAPPPPSAPALDTTQVTNDTTPLPSGTVSAGLSTDPVQEVGFMAPSQPIFEPSQAGDGSTTAGSAGPGNVSAPDDGASAGNSGTERILVAEGNTRVSEVVSPDGRVTSVRASIQVEVAANGQVVFNDVQKQAFGIVGLSVSSISSGDNGLSVSIADAARGQDTQFYTGELGNGESLPDWITVDQTTGEITIGNPPPGIDAVTVRVKAIGSDGKVRMLDIELKLSDLLKRKSLQDLQPDSTETLEPVGFVPLTDQVAAEVASSDGYGERLIALLESA